MSPPIIDTSKWPYIEIAYQASMTTDDIDAYRVAMRPVYARGQKEPCVVVIDTRQTPSERATLDARRGLVSVVNQLQKEYPNVMLAEAVIVDGNFTASLYMAYTWLIHDKFTARRSFRDKPQAIAWAKSFLSKPAAHEPNIPQT